MIGVVNLGDVNNSLDKFEQQWERQVINEKSVATHACIYDLRSIYQP